MAEFVIVGGGVYGCAVAWELARRGAGVLVLEAATIAAGASGGLGKRGVRANGRDRRELPLMRLAYTRWPGLSQAIGGPTGYQQTGHLMLIEREGDLAMAGARLWLQQTHAIPTELITGARLRDMEPGLSPAVQAALFCPRDGVADHSATTRSLAQAAERLGARIETGVAVTGLETRGDRVVAIRTAAGERRPVARALLLLANAGTADLVQASGGPPLPVWSRLPQVVLAATPPTPVRHLIGHAHRRLALKMVPGPGVEPGSPEAETEPAAGQCLMVSGGWSGRWNADTGRGETVPEQVAGNLAEARAVFPALADVVISQAQADRRESQSIDGIPIIDRLPGTANGFLATGWSGHGWALAPAVARLLADWALGGERPTLLAPFRYRRFRRPR